MNIGVLGAPGPAGGGLAARLSSLGYEVIAGSRDAARAEAAVAKTRERWGDRVSGLKAGANADAAAADVVFVATQWEAAVSTAAQHADALAGKAVVAMANGLIKHGREFHPVLPDGGSLANAVGLEAFAAVLLTINLRHKGKASLRLVGVDPPPPPGP